MAAGSCNFDVLLQRFDSETGNDVHGCLLTAASILADTDLSHTCRVLVGSSRDPAKPVNVS
jgi:hypothetical protein